MLDVTSEKIKDIVIIGASGEIDYHNFSMLKSSVEQALTEGSRKFIFDLGRISYIDSSALGSLLYNQKRIRENHGVLLVVASEAIEDILNLTHLDTYFKMVQSIDEGQKKLTARTESKIVALKNK